MYQLLQDLFPYVVAFYILDGLAYVRRHQVLFVSPWGGRFSAKPPGLYLAGLPPTAEAVAGFELPVAVSARGLWVPKAPPHPQRVLDSDDLAFMAFGDLGAVEVEDRTVKGSGRVLVEAPSPAAARHLASLLEELRHTEAPGRVERLRAVLASATDLDALRELRRTRRRFVPHLRGLGLALAAVVFLLLPLALYTEWPWRPDGVALLIGAAPLHVAVVVLSVLTLRRCGLARKSAVSAVLPMVFFPPSAVHALSFLVRDLYARFDPMALAAELLAPGAFHDFARRELNRAGQAREGADGDLAAWWRLREEAWEGLFARIGRSSAEIQAPPPKADPSAAGYCPLCSAEYRDGFTTCVDCGVALKPFADG